MLGCSRIDGDACIVMTLYPKSAAKRLEELQGVLENPPPVSRRHCLVLFWDAALQ